MLCYISLRKLIQEGPARVRSQFLTELKFRPVTPGFHVRFDGSCKINTTALRDMPYWTAARLMLYILSSQPSWESGVAVPMSQVRNLRVGTVGPPSPGDPVGKGGAGT